jgi:LmbE family N-acetylglucosaminyl deacetylase
MTRKVAAIFAHPDDEVLGAGGALALHGAVGDDIRIALLATGLAARGTAPADDLEHLRAQAEAAAKCLGAGPVTFHDFPDNAMDTVPLIEIVRAVEAFLDDFPADIIYTHHGGDLNIDHRITRDAVLTACRPIPGARPIEIFACEVNSSTEWAAPPHPAFAPSDFLDIANVLEAKVAALECYTGEIRDWPHPRSSEGVRALARWRGSQCGREAAEAYELVRRVRHAL